jgi:Ca2+-binding EF-hand superfamily protein
MGDENEAAIQHIRAQYARQENYDQFYEGDLFDTPDGQVSAAEFDRIMAAHDAELTEKVRREILEELQEQFAEKVAHLLTAVEDESRHPVARESIARHAEAEIRRLAFVREQIAAIRTLSTTTPERSND